MNKIKKYKKRTGFLYGIFVLMFSQVIIKIVGLAYKLYLTNKEGFGDKGNAIYNSGFQIYAMLLTLSSIGVPNAISKLVSEKLALGDNKGAYRIFKIAFALFGIIGFVGSTILFLGAKVIANKYLQVPESELTLMALSPSVFLVSISSVLRGYFNGKGNLKVTANSQSLEQIFKTILTIILVEQISHISSSNTMLMAATATLATTLATLFSLIYLYKYFIMKKKEVWQEVISSTYNKKEKVKKIIKNILIISIPMALSSLLSVINKTIDALTIVRILKTYLTETEATIQYGILSGKVDTLINLPFSFNIAFATALVPEISSAIAKGKIKDAEKKINFSIIITSIIGISCTIFMSSFANIIIRTLFPKAQAGATILKLASLDIIFVVLTQTINGALQGLGKVNIPVIAFGIGVCIKLVLNIILIRIQSIGIYGAIISTIISHIVSFIICFIVLKKNLKNAVSLKLFINSYKQNIKIKKQLEHSN
jgi:stage V sporulation protein B